MSGDSLDRFSVDFTGRTLLGIYRVERKLAEGGMGAIYLATDTNLDRPVVVKVPHPRFLGEPEFRARFSREVEELIRLEHPRIARILARGEHDGVPFFVLQHLGGGSLEDRLREAGDRPGGPAGVLDWLAPVAEALDFVHDRGIVHRDVKPANILFDDAGNAFLSDFGVAKVCGAAEAAITGTGVGIGSPLYMAPEQATGEDVTGAADQYALASTAYEALAGRPPFEGHTPVEIFVAKAQRVPDAITDHVPDVPGDVADCIARALARETSERFPSCGAFADAYRAGLAGAAPPAGMPSRRGARALLAIAVVALLGIVAFLAFRDGEPDGSSPERTLVVLDAGAEPREALRYRPAAGATQALALTLTMETTTRTDGEEPWTRGPSGETIDSEVRVVESGEGIPIRWIITSGPLSGAVARGRLTRTGRLESLDFEPGERSPEDPADLRPVAAVFAQLPVPLPDEPVGIGATWAVTEAVTLLGSRLLQTVRYELVERDGDRLKIRVSTGEVAPPRESLALGPELDIEVSSFQARGRGRCDVDLARPIPEASSYRQTMSLSGMLRKKPTTITIELTTEVAAR
jgi:hypothetical protein